MGFFSSITKPFKRLTKALGKGVKDVFKMGKSALKNSFSDLLHPDRLIKNTLRNPLGQITRMVGADIFFPDGPSVGQQKQLAQYSSGDGDTASPQERARMLSRQGMQGTNPPSCSLDRTFKTRRSTTRKSSEVRTYDGRSEAPLP